MRDLGAKMAELKFEAPLAQFEETDEWGGNDFITQTVGGGGNNVGVTNGGGVGANNANTLKSLSDTLNLNLKETDNILLLEEAVRDVHISKNGSPNCNSGNTTTTNINNAITTMNMKDTNVDNFTETFSGSLEDLVNTFDEKITKCFGNYEENVEELAPVQVRSQEEIMNECQMWWTITGNFGNILPIDWSKSYARQMHMPTLNLQQKKISQKVDGDSSQAQTPDELNDLSSEDEAVANDLDMHALILNGLNPDNDEPIKTAEEVIKEIDDIMDESTPSEDEVMESEVMEKAKEVLGSPLYEEKLQSLTISQLNELYMEMEVLIREFSETLINELALRDELEYEKELKNTFISLLLAVQNKRRQYHVEKKRGKTQGLDPKYLTTVIPYNLESGSPDNQALQVLIKILKAINEDSPTVPTLLTDYILKVLCPT
ncbi:fasciculation and elongation protein zeta-2 isoform X2 [Condylostylus longicornis]|uniref:fasciculation and elongation protein zeta-2 isoform X2 n=1 Tax=Condylostylus longicornis TaxID=2530218 RepID=UPI00244E3EFB|nr:fasciculation and elongation protein zeta-2 isoform X2 [Condylostylus longicornis]